MCIDAGFDEFGRDLCDDHRHKKKDKKTKKDKKETKKESVHRVEEEEYIGPPRHYVDMKGDRENLLYESLHDGDLPLYDPPPAAQSHHKPSLADKRLLSAMHTCTHYIHYIHHMQTSITCTPRC